MLHDFYDTVLATTMIHLESHHRTHIWELSFQKTSRLDSSSKPRKQIEIIALLDKVLDLLQPAEVLLLLLDVDVLGNEDGEISVNTTLIEVGLEESLEVLVKLGEGRAGVHLLR